MAEQSAHRYRFGPLEDGGHMLGLRLPQAAFLGGTVLVDIVLIHRQPSTPTLLFAAALLLAALAATLLPLWGRTLDQWAPVAAHFYRRRLLGRDRFVCQAPLTGRVSAAPATMDLPDSLAGMEILAAPLANGHELGVLRDARRHTYTAVIRCRGTSFGLADDEEKTRRFGHYGGFLSAVGRESGEIARIQWVDVAVPDDGHEIVRHTQRRRAMPEGSRPVDSLLQLLATTAAVTQRHETHIAIQISARHRSVVRAGGGDDAGCSALAREISHLRGRLENAEIEVVGLLSPRELARTIRLAYDPAARARLGREGMREGRDPGVDPSNAWPMAIQEGWSTLRTNSAFHSTYWVKDWPRTEVGPDWLMPLLLECRRQVTVSVTMEPVAAAKGEREIRGALQEHDSNQSLLQRAGWRTSASKRKQTEGVLQREEEMAEGWTLYRYSGFITVSASAPEELEDACVEVEQQASQAHLQLRRMAGEQEIAFTYTLPMCRGLRWGLFDGARP